MTKEIKMKSIEIFIGEDFTISISPYQEVSLWDNRDRDKFPIVLGEYSSIESALEKIKEETGAKIVNAKIVFYKNEKK